LGVCKNCGFTVPCCFKDEFACWVFDYDASMM